MPPEPSVVLSGASGFLGHHLVEALRRARIPFLVAARPASRVPAGCERIDLDLADPASVARVAAALGPRSLLHAGAMATQADCERAPDLAAQVNCDSAIVLLRRARRWLFVSTDLVFDGTRPPYDEDAATAPLSVYGATKAAAEQELRRVGGGVVVRVPLLFGPSPGGDRGATDMIRAAARAGRPARLFVDEFRTPVHAAWAADALVHALLAGEHVGIRHLPGPQRVSRFELGRMFVRRAGLPETAIVPAVRAEMPGPPRPGDLTLVSAASLVPAGRDWRLEPMLAQA